MAVRSAGTSSKAKRTVGSVDIHWADIIFVMEEKHKKRLKAEFSGLLNNKPLYVLDIPDEYSFMDPELMQLVEEAVRPCLDH